MRVSRLVPLLVLLLLLSGGQLLMEVGPLEKETHTCCYCGSWCTRPSNCTCCGCFIRGTPEKVDKGTVTSRTDRMEAITVGVERPRTFLGKLDQALPAISGFVLSAIL